VLIGKQEKPYMVHEKAITKASKFFAAACFNGMKESVEKAVRLPDLDDIDVFETYLHWVYTSEIEVSAIGSEDQQTKQAKVIICSVRTYILADQLGDIRCKNCALAALA
jgi:hypothetical protein